MIYQFRQYAEKVNANQAKDIPDTGFEVGKGHMVAVNFGDNFDVTQPYTVVCSGARRGGTSMLPYALSRMGLSMGKTENHTYEDTDFLRNRQNAEKLRQLIARRNDEAERWGFKIPALRRGQYGFFDDTLRAPVFLFICRNPVLTAQAFVRSGANPAFPENRGGFAAAMQDGLQAFLEFTAFLTQTGSPCLLLPMEQFQRAPRPFLAEIAERLGLDAADALLDDLVENINTPGFKPSVSA